MVPYFCGSLKFYRPYLDGIFGIWGYLEDPTEDKATWDAFNTSLNNYHGLK